jgi:hypothetical protein
VTFGRALRRLPALALLVALAAPAAARDGVPTPRAGGQTRTWLVRPGDTPESIARRFHMGLSDLRRLNPGMGTDVAVGGAVLVQLPMPVGTRVASAIHRRPGAPGREPPAAPPATAAHRPGGYALARRPAFAPRQPGELHVPAGVGAVQPVAPRFDGPSRRAAGFEATWPAAIARGVAEGRPQDGVLRDPVRLPAVPGIFLRRPERAWGTGRLVQVLLHAVAAVARAHRDTQVIAVGDLSAPDGGPLSGHRSHQNGRDADIAFYTLDGSTADRFVAVTPATLDAARTWTFLEALLDTGALQFAFIDHALQAPLYEHALAHASPRWRTPDALARVFQYPMPEWTAVGIIRHEPNHRDHIHLRILSADEPADVAAALPGPRVP